MTKSEKRTLELINDFLELIVAQKGRSELNKYRSKIGFIQEYLPHIKFEKNE
jgi:hypothetical protein